MKRPVLIASLLFVSAAVSGTAADFFDRVEDALTFSTPDAQIRARLSGAVDLEGYSTQLPTPALIHTNRADMFAPRLSVFLDAQFGSAFYFFAQARADRGFDPTGEGGTQVRLDEYALRFSPGHTRHLNVQVGKFATIVGNWAARHASWANPFITAPLPYENLTGVWDAEALRNTNVLLQWSHVRPGLPAAVTAIEKTLRIPIVWGPGYATGVAVSGDFGKFRYAADVKAGSLSSRPEAWQHAAEQWNHPTVSARLGYRPSPMWNMGFSASTGSYLREMADASLRAGRSRRDYRETVVAHDIAFAWHHLQVWGEVYAARFEIPAVANADTVAYYVEAKYKFTPQFFGAVRWNEQLFGSVLDRGRMTRWGHNAARVDFSPGYRFTPHTQLKLQYSLQQEEGAPRDYSRMLAAQLTVRF